MIEMANKACTASLRLDTEISLGQNSLLSSHRRRKLTKAFEVGCTAKLIRCEFNETIAFLIVPIAGICV